MSLLNKLTEQLKYSQPTVEFIDVETKDIMTVSGYSNYTYEDKTNKKIKQKDIPKNYKTLSTHEIQNILDENIVNLFPKTGEWTSSCYQGKGLQCHLRDSSYLATWFKEKLESKNIYISEQEILKYVKTSSLFKEYRHNYELEIVKWQINWMRSGGEGWLMPNGVGEFDLLFNPDVDEIFRAGVVKTLTAIGMNKDVVEEGIEKHADLWRENYMRIAFKHAFEPISFARKTKLEPATEEHRENWLKMRRYQYYQKHRTSIIRYGSIHPDMELSDIEIEELENILEDQNAERFKSIKSWREMKHDTKDVHYSV